MKLIEPSYSILEQKPGIDGIYEQIELAGRTCYKSIRPEGKTAKDFVDKLINSKHYAMLEHGTVYLKIPTSIIDNGDIGKEVNKLLENSYTAHYIDYDYWYFSTNYRVILEHNLFKVMPYLCEPTEFHEKRVTIKFITSIGIVRELLRHRKFSFANESTRYCNYSKDKFNNELTFIIPSWLELPEAEYGTIENPEEIQFKTYDNDQEKELINCLICTEFRYFELLKAGCVPQQAREVLPLATKSELIMTGFISDWKYLFDLRVKGTTGLPHPDIKALCEPLMKEFITKKYISNEKI